MGNREGPVVDGHLVRKRFEFYGHDTEKKLSDYRYVAIDYIDGQPGYIA